MDELLAYLRAHRPESFCREFAARHADADPDALRVLVDEDVNGVMLVPLTEKVVIPEGPYTCPRCRSRRVVVENRQTRSADEGQTSFYGCECGHTWRN